MKILEEDLLKGHGRVARFDFDRYDHKTGKMNPYGKGFLHADMEVACNDSKNCREKSHSIFFTWKEVIRGEFLPVVGTKVSFVALPAKNGLAPRAIKLRLKD